MSDEKKNGLPEEEMEQTGDELSDGIIELTDEDGVTTQFEFLTTIEHEGGLYVVLMAADDGETDDEEGEVVILKIEEDPETGEDMYVSVDDDNVTQAVFDKFIAMMDAEENE